MDGGRAGSERTTRCTVPLASHRDRALFPYEGACLGACAPTREKACLLRPMAPGHPVADDCLPTPAMNGRGRLCGSAPGVREIFPPDFPPPLGLPPRHHRTVPRPGGSGAWARPRSEVSHSASGYCSPSVPLPPAEGPQHRGEASVSSPAVRTEAADLFLPLQHLPFPRKGQPLCFAPFPRGGTRRRDRAPKVHPNSLESARPDAAIGGEAPFPSARMRYLARYPRRPLRIWEEITAGP